MATKTPVPLTAEEQIKAKHFLDIFKTKEDLRYWVYNYLDIWLPFGWVDSDSNSSPGDAIWEAYVTYRDDLYVENPGYIWLSSRDGAKTLSGSILNVLLLFHFKAEIAHLAAVKKQAEKCLEYTNIFIRKIDKYIEYHGRRVVGESKSKIQILNEDGSISFIDVIVASVAGGNSQRSNVGSYDELDTLTPQGLAGYNEAKLIPTRKLGRGPLTIKYSTRKYAFGIFEKEIQQINTTGEQLKRWNLIDMTEKCQDDRSLKDNGNKHVRYVKKTLPNRLYTEQEFEEMAERDRTDVDRIEIYDGCLRCPLANTCRGKLAHRPDADVWSKQSLFKTIDFTIGQFRKTSIELAEAQLMCWRPSTKGLIYPRFTNDNIISIDSVWEMLTGDKEKNVQLNDLILKMRECDTKFYGGVDWGHTHLAAFSVVGVIPTGQSILMESVGVPGLETHEFCELAIPFQEKYGVLKWFCDNSQPAAIKTFKRVVGASCPDFTKDVMGGIGAVRSQILTTAGYRRFYVLDIPENEFVIEGFRSHHFVLDALGNPTQKRADDEWADVMDGIRYIGQNLYNRGGKVMMVTSTASSAAEGRPKSDIKDEQVRVVNEQKMKEQITAKIGEAPVPTVKKKGGLHWSF